MDAPVPETRVTPWKSYPYYGKRRVRIWTRFSHAFGWQQRHEWERQDGTIDLEDWIKTCPSHGTNSVTINVPTNIDATAMRMAAEILREVARGALTVEALKARAAELERDAEQIREN